MRFISLDLLRLYKVHRSIVLGGFTTPMRVRGGWGGIEGGAVNVDYIDGKVVTTDLNPFAHPTRRVISVSWTSPPGHTDGIL